MFIDAIKSVLSVNRSISREEAAVLLKTTPEALDAFEDAYQARVFEGDGSDNLFDVNAADIRRNMKEDREVLNTETIHKKDEIVSRIIKELLAQTEVLVYDRRGLSVQRFPKIRSAPVTYEEILSLPVKVRPQLSGTLMKKDLSGPPSYLALLEQWQQYKEAETLDKKKTAYHMFRQGLDILDLDPVLYEMLGLNPNAIGYWFPALAKAVSRQGFFRIPKTKILKVPLPMLQLTRLNYGSLTQGTMQVVDEYCFKAFGLDENKEYFVKTGTYSSKFDFRNAHVHGAKEVRELGEYLLYIQHQACVAAGPLSSPCIYGMSTTNEWCVREYIKDREQNPCIYKGMPLHTEYRVFVDFDTDEILGIAPYWNPTIMKQRLGHEPDADNPHNVHDYTVFLMHEETLMRRYLENKGKVLEHIVKIVPEINLTGQWSIDIMQNGDDFWVIDMALAANSALKECVPVRKMKPVEENWIPRLEDDKSK